MNDELTEAELTATLAAAKAFLASMPGENDYARLHFAMGGLIMAADTAGAAASAFSTTCSCLTEASVEVAITWGSGSTKHTERFGPDGAIDIDEPEGELH